MEKMDFLLPYISFFSALLSVIALLLIIIVPVIVIRRNPKRIKLILQASPILVLVMVILLCCASFWISALVSMRELNRFVYNFEQIPHPDESELVVSERRTGLLVGNSNHCDFFAGQMRWSMLTHQEIEDFYRGKTIPFARDPEKYGMHSKNQTAVVIRVIFYEEKERTENTVAGFLGWLPYSLDTFYEWNIDLEDYPEGVLYIVYAFDVGYEPGPWSFHCH